MANLNIQYTYIKEYLKYGNISRYTIYHNIIIVGEVMGNMLYI